jgi:hypothetical protein
MLAVLSAARAAAAEPGLSRDWTGINLRISEDAGQAALADALQVAAGHRCPLVLDCPERHTAAALIRVLALLSGTDGLTVAVAVAVRPAGGGCRLRAVRPQLSTRRWWRFWATRTPGGAW